MSRPVVSQGDIAPELRGYVPVARIAMVAFAISAAAFALGGWRGDHHGVVALAPVIIVLLLFRALTRRA